MSRVTLTTHALVGAAAASMFPEQPYAAFAAGFASHFLIDAIPHWDYIDYIRSFKRDPHGLDSDMELGRHFLRDLAILGADALLGAVLVLLIMCGWLGIPVEVAFIGAGAGLYPDLLQFVYWKTRKTFIEPSLELLQRFHRLVQQTSPLDVDPRLGLGLQAALVVAVVVLLKFFSV